MLYYRSIAGNPDTVPLVIEGSQRDYCIKSNGFVGVSALTAIGLYGTTSYGFASPISELAACCPC